MPMSARRARPLDPGRAMPIGELDRVVLDESVDTPNGPLPNGARGTVVLVWRGGEAIEVEFTEPFQALVMLRPDQIRAVPAASDR